MRSLRLYLQTVLFSLMLVLLSLNANAEEMDCITCHAELKGKKVIHAAVDMGCATCHAGIDAREVPHKKTNKIDKGLSSTMPELCYGCHDRGMFTRKNVHPALMMGCMSCHDPHSSGSDKLLRSSMPDLCFNCHDRGGFGGKKTVHAPVAAGMCVNCHDPHSSLNDTLFAEAMPLPCFTCHDKEMFSGKITHAPVGIGLCVTCHNPHQADRDRLLTDDIPVLCFTCHDKSAFTRKKVHPPVEGGMCLNCHNAHASRESGLLAKRPILVCLECHSDVMKKPHAVAGFGSTMGGHPLGSIKPQKKIIKDPLNPDKEYYCGSCHQPHSSDWGRLFRYQADSTMGLCQYCHKY